MLRKGMRHYPYMNFNFVYLCNCFSLKINITYINQVNYVRNKGKVVSVLD